MLVWGVGEVEEKAHSECASAKPNSLTHCHGYCYARVSWRVGVWVKRWGGCKGERKKTQGKLERHPQLCLYSLVAAPIVVIKALRGAIVCNDHAVGRDSLSGRVGVSIAAAADICEEWHSVP